MLLVVTSINNIKTQLAKEFNDFREKWDRKKELGIK